MRNHRRIIAGEEILRFPKGEHEGVLNKGFLGFSLKSLYNF